MIEDLQSFFCSTIQIQHQPKNRIAYAMFFFPSYKQFICGRRVETEIMDEVKLVGPEAEVEHVGRSYSRRVEP